MSKVPPGWSVATLKDLIGQNGIFTDGDWILSEHLRTGNDVRLIQLADIGVGRFLNKSQKFISKTTAEELGVTYLREDDVLISRMAEPLARACLFPRLQQPSITAVDVAIARPDQSVSLPLFLMYLCNSYLVLNQAEAVAVGTTRKRISRKNLESLSVPVPPVNEQRGIVSKLERLLSRVDTAQGRLATIPRILKRFRQSVLAFACSGRLTQDWRVDNEAESIEPLLLENQRRNRKLVDASKNGSRFRSSNSFDWDMFPDLPRNWCWGAAAEVVEVGAEIVYGIVQPGPEIANGIPYVRGLDIQNGRILIEQLRRTSHKIALKYERASLKGGDVLLGIIRNTKVAIVPEALNGANITQGTARLRPSVIVSSAFLALWLESKYSQDWLHMHYRGIDMPGLNLADVRKLPVPLPPRNEQLEIVRRVEALFKTADALEARYHKAKAHVDKLTQSILAKAFRGELVPQDPNDEPASVLLERIREQRDRAPVKMSRKSRKSNK